jgi:hypothetical protein
MRKLINVEYSLAELKVSNGSTTELLATGVEYDLHHRITFRKEYSPYSTVL